MYDHLVGEVVEKQPSRAVLRCGGVGYECRISLTTAGQLGVGRTQQVFTLLHVVDGTPSLLGFATRDERDLARRLLSVSSVGPSIALALLSVHAPGELAAAIARGDVAALRRVKGIGQKIAERLCLELREAMAAFASAAGGPAVPLPMQSADDAVAALVTLGFSEKEARDRVDRVRRQPEAAAGTDTEALVKAVLRM
ncbi:MAG: Holliday junction branch migration protein RuvA [Planctomycetes bacterium]|nr:Holliday junction branch migration protein RuvA [Planctomycetota bacterium]